MKGFDEVKKELPNSPGRWLVTGAAGFIGSHLVEFLLKADQQVVGLDNFSTGYQTNLDQVKELVSEAQWKRFNFIREDIQDLTACKEACRNADFVLHQAALGSVPRSIEDPILTNASNISGFLNMIVAARDAGVRRFVYAASGSTYGDHPGLPKKEEIIGKPLSPYAVTKYVNELYAEVFTTLYKIETVGLRYFNVFGPRQDPNGAYAAVIPRWVSNMIKNETVYINGTGETSRDFCYVENAVQANLLAAVTKKKGAVNQVYNVALNERTSLNELYSLLKEKLIPHYPHLKSSKPDYRDFRPGDVLHSQADISKAGKLLGYAPECRIGEGLDKSLPWYRKHLH